MIILMKLMIKISLLAFRGFFPIHLPIDACLSILHISPASIEMIISGEKWSFSIHFNVSQFCERCSPGSSENENVFYFRARVFNIRHHLQLTPSFIFSNTIIPKLRPQIPLIYFSKFQKPFLIHMPFKNRPLVSEPPSYKSFQFIIGFKLHFPTNE